MTVNPFTTQEYLIAVWQRKINTGECVLVNTLGNKTAECEKARSLGYAYETPRYKLKFDAEDECRRLNSENPQFHYNVFSVEVPTVP